VGVQGDISIVSGGAKQAAKNGQLLKPGDTVASGGGTASVILTSGVTRVLKKGDSFTLPSGKVMPDPVIGRVMKAIGEIDARGDDPTVKGMVRATIDGLVPVEPRNTYVSPGGLRFQWKGTMKDAELEIFVKAPEPEYRHAFKVSAGTNNAALPADAPPLKSGVKYYWKLRAQREGDEKPRESDLCWFGILSAEDAKAADAGVKFIDELADVPPAQKAYLAAHCLLSYGLNQQALRKLEDALKADPKDESLRSLHRKIGGE
jgi:hypothetical protein